jgi:periodic tryptophan protein 2
MPEVYVAKLLKYLGTELETTRHLHFYGIWCKSLLSHHGLWLKSKSGEHMPVLNLLHRNLTSKTKNLGELCERNSYTMQFLLTMSKLKKAAVKEKDLEIGEESKNGIHSDSDDELMDTNGTHELQSKWSDDEDSD